MRQLLDEIREIVTNRKTGDNEKVCFIIDLVLRQRASAIKEWLACKIATAELLEKRAYAEANKKE